MKEILFLIFFISFIYSEKLDLMVQVKTLADVSKLNSFAKSNQMTFESILPETKVSRKRTETIMQLERYFYTKVETGTIKNYSK